ncbi:MAG: gliding motility protein GldL [Bacteroidetes bacterium]|nr:gliding motility protein GldL [Bacteroidota bacterium]
MEDSTKKDFKAVLYGEVMPKVYGIGAAIVITGAMFKILNWPLANLMIGVGLTTEAMIFFLSAFEPKQTEHDWTKVYPELDEDYEGPLGMRNASGAVGGAGSKAYEKEMSELAKTLKTLNAAYSQEAKGLNSRLESSNKLFASGAKTLEEMQKASNQAEEFRLELEKLREKIAALNDIYDNTLNALRG